MALRWSKIPRPKGLAGVVAAGRYQGLRLKRDGREVARVGYDRGRNAYYWYGERGSGHHNSLWTNTVYATEDEAKAAALAFVRGD